MWLFSFRDGSGALTAGGGRTLFYWWLGARGPETLTFKMGEDILEWGVKDFGWGGDPTRLHLDALRGELPAIEKRFGVKMSIVETSGGASVTMDGNTAEFGAAQQYLEKRTREIQDVVYAEKMYRRAEGRSVIADYELIVHRHAMAMEPVAAALRKPGESLRLTVERAVSFLQAIPYSASFSNNSGFQTPVGMLAENKGNCDTKSAALAAILINYGVRTVLIATDAHMFVGIEIPQTDGDASAVFGGVRYVLAEPTGPRILPVGQVSELAMRNGKILSHHIIPINLLKEKR